MIYLKSNLQSEIYKTSLNTLYLIRFAFYKSLCEFSNFTPKLNVLIPLHKRICHIGYTQRVSPVSYLQPSQLRLPGMELIGRQNRIL